MTRGELFSLVVVLGCVTECLAADPVKPAPGAKPVTPESKEPAKSARISSQVQVQPATTLTDKENRELSFAAGRLLKHVAQARTAIAENKTDRATKDVDQAVKLMQIIDGVLPRYKMKTTIHSGDLLYSDEDEFTPEFITVFEELERRDIVSPILRAKADAAPKSGPQPAAQDESRAQFTSASRMSTIRPSNWTWISAGDCYARPVNRLARTIPSKPIGHWPCSSRPPCCWNTTKSTCRLRKLPTILNWPKPK